MKITLLQSADPARYAQLLMLSSRSVQAFCACSNLSYDMTLGIRYGCKPWHAALNRIVILQEYCQRGYDGWVLYIDADAYVVDLSFDLRGYLSERQNAALIAARSGIEPRRWWDINNGVFAINLAHPLARQLVASWHERLRAYPEDALCAESRWGEICDDQEMMHDVIRSIVGFEQALLHDDDPHVLNWNGCFISQLVRTTGSLDERIQALQQRVNQVLRPHHEPASDVIAGIRYNAGRMTANDDFVSALYKVLLRRPADPEGRQNAVHGLNNGTVSYEQELRNCLSSLEFAEGIDAFKQAYLRRSD